MNDMNEKKIYVDVNVRFFKDGKVRPLSITWRNGVTYEIDRVKEVRRAASLVAGGIGMRYTCVICGRESHLFYEDNNKWFVEGK